MLNFLILMGKCYKNNLKTMKTKSTSISLTHWYPPPGKNFIVSYMDSLDDCSKRMFKL